MVTFAKPLKLLAKIGKLMWNNFTMIKLNSNGLYLKGDRQESTGRYDLTKVLHTSVNAACCLHNTIVCRCTLCSKQLLLPVTLWKNLNVKY